MNKLVLSCLLYCYVIAMVAGKRRRNHLFCASRSHMEAALDTAEDAAARKMPRRDARKLVDKIRSLERKRGDQVCFTRENFRIIGHIVAKAGHRGTPDSPDTPNSLPVARFASFARPSVAPWENNNKGQCTGCGCRCKCGGNAEPWCGAFSPGCCPLFCGVIFRTISIGALSRLNEDGISTCCRDAMWGCIVPPKITINQKKDTGTNAGVDNNEIAALAAASTSPEPKKFQFRAPPSESPKYWKKNKSNGNENENGKNGSGYKKDSGWQKKRGNTRSLGSQPENPLLLENSSESIVDRNGNINQVPEAIEIASVSPTPRLEAVAVLQAPTVQDESPSPSPLPSPSIEVNANSEIESIPIPSYSPIVTVSLSPSPSPTTSPVLELSVAPLSANISEIERTSVPSSLNRRRTTNNRARSKMK